VPQTTQLNLTNFRIPTCHHGATSYNNPSHQTPFASAFRTLEVGQPRPNIKKDNIQHFANSAEIDVFLMTENNIAWHKLSDKKRIQERMRGWWESLHVNTAHNTTDQNARAYQPGRVGVFSINQIAHRVQSFSSDPMGLGWYCWAVLYGRDNKRFQVVAAYRPRKLNNGHLSMSQQHWQHFVQPTQKGETTAHPQTQFWTDLKPLIQTWIDGREQILIGMDVNEQVNHPEVTDYFFLKTTVYSVNTRSYRSNSKDHTLLNNAITYTIIHSASTISMWCYAANIDLTEAW